jgi:large subunit ribosomal protein L23
MTSQGDKFNRYGFLVAKNANKLQIRKAVEELYGVTVNSVNTMRYGGKIKTRNTKSGLLVGKTAATKKAVVTLAEGNKIDFYSNI